MYVCVYIYLYTCIYSHVYSHVCFVMYLHVCIYTYVYEAQKKPDYLQILKGGCLSSVCDFQMSLFPFNMAASILLAPMTCDSTHSLL